MSTEDESKKNGFLKKWFILNANFREERNREEIKRILIITLVFAGIVSAIREAFRRRLDGDWIDDPELVELAEFKLGEVEPLVVIITAVLTMTFYPLLYLTYSYIYKGTEDRDTTIVLYNVTILAQLAVLRDVLFILYAAIDFSNELFQSGDIVSDETYNFEMPFMMLDGILWILSIILLMPIVVDRLNRPKEREDTQLIALLMYVFAFFLTWTFNYQILRIFIQLPLGVEV
jgi:formate hydrogenlyase subunit 3/multisubunit Na+/H+ antiporter MnhD subunit